LKVSAGKPSAPPTEVKQVIARGIPNRTDHLSLDRLFDPDSRLCGKNVG
jgi:hypothetical protein